jgi:hypothetical protein
VLFAVVIVGVWVLTTCIPFYVWIILVLSIVAVFRTFGTRAKSTESGDATSPVQNCCASFLSNVLTAREKFLGVYLGMVVTCFLFWLFSLRVGVLYGFSTSAAYVSSASAVSFNAPDLDGAFLNLGGLSGSTDDVGLFWATLLSLLLSTALWFKLVWFDTDPGAVRTRHIDFDVIMDECLRSAGVPPAHKYCRTTLVRKPLRSKYCTQTGMVIARMDHFCIWLNNSVGFRNHRSFIVFLVWQLVATALYASMLIRALQRELGFNASACVALGTLLDEKYFFATALTVFLCGATLALGALLTEQSVNVAKNITTNERLNRSRYPWMHDSDGKPFNNFDRGVCVNTLEFWGVPGFQRDYYAEFELPQQPAAPAAAKPPPPISSPASVGPTSTGGAAAPIADTEPSTLLINRGDDTISGVNPNPNAAVFLRRLPPQQTALPASRLTSTSPLAIPQSRAPSYRVNGEVLTVAKAEVVAAQADSLGTSQHPQQVYRSENSVTATPSTSTLRVGGSPLPVRAAVAGTTPSAAVGADVSASPGPVLARPPILTRTMQAQAQLEARVQQAIGLSLSLPAAGGAVSDAQRGDMVFVDKALLHSGGGGGGGGGDSGRPPSVRMMGDSAQTPPRRSTESLSTRLSPLSSSKTSHAAAAGEVKWGGDSRDDGSEGSNNSRGSTEDRHGGRLLFGTPLRQMGGSSHSSAETLDTFGQHLHASSSVLHPSDAPFDFFNAPAFGSSTSANPAAVAAAEAGADEPLTSSLPTSSSSSPARYAELHDAQVPPPMRPPMSAATTTPARRTDSAVAPGLLLPPAPAIRRPLSVGGKLSPGADSKPIATAAATALKVEPSLFTSRHQPI